MALTPATWLQLQSAFPGDVYLHCRAGDPGTIRRAAVGGSTWSTRTRSQYWEADWVMMHSASEDPAVRARETAEHLAWHESFADGGDIAGMTFTAGTALPPGKSAGETSAWSWMWTDASRAQAHEDSEVIVIEHGDPRLLELLAHSETASHERDGVVPDAWFGIVEGGSLMSAAAVKVSPGFTYLQSVVTRRDRRGRGLAARVCSHATSWSLARATYATLGLMTDNLTARRLYERLGYVCEKDFASVKFA